MPKAEMDHLEAVNNDIQSNKTITFNSNTGSWALISFSDGRSQFEDLSKFQLTLDLLKRNFLFLIENSDPTTEYNQVWC